MLKTLILMNLRQVCTFNDIKKLFESHINALVEQGDSVIIIEQCKYGSHQPAVYIIDLGPEGGNQEDTPFTGNTR